MPSFTEAIPFFFYQNSYLIRLQYPIHEKSGCDVPEKVKDDVGKKRKLKISWDFNKTDIYL